MSVLKRLVPVLLCCLLLCSGCGKAAADTPQRQLSRITLELRTGTRWGEYDPEQNGVPLLAEDGSICGGIEILSDASLQIGEDAAIVGWPQSGSISRQTALPAPGGVPCVAVLYQPQTGAARWVALYQPTQGGPVFAVWLAADQFPYESFEAFALSANFAP